MGTELCLGATQSCLFGTHPPRSFADSPLCSAVGEGEKNMLICNKRLLLAHLAMGDVGIFHSM